jgi:hypothetical protein
MFTLPAGVIWSVSVSSSNLTNMSGSLALNSTSASSDSYSMMSCDSGSTTSSFASP